MAYSVEWMNEDHTITRVSVSGLAEASEFELQLDALWTLIKDVDYPMYQIGDYSELMNIPKGMFPIFLRSSRHPVTNHKHTRLIIFIVPKTLHMPFAELVMKLMPLAKTKLVHSMEQAMSIIESDQQARLAA